MIIYVDTSEVQPGKLEELKGAITQLADFVERNEPEILGYEVFFSDDGKRMTVIHMHRDQASLETHMDVAGGEFPKFAPLVRLVSIDLYGDVDAALVDRLRGKARMLGAGVVRVHPHHAGFVRFGDALGP